MIEYDIKEYVEGNTVEVTFIDEDTGIQHVRTVNAVFTEGEYDHELTIERVRQVAMGVAHKISVGVIVHTEQASAAVIPQPPIPEDT